jgi:hypothetical protein
MAKQNSSMIVFMEIESLVKKGAFPQHGHPHSSEDELSLNSSAG